MYKIFINNNPILLTDSQNVLQHLLPKHKVTFLDYLGKPKLLLQAIDKLEKSPKPTQIIVFHANLEKLYQDFFALHKYIEAAGGAVFNQEKLLTIFRRGSWDLPKGKIDEGETTTQAALREVMEETGLQEVVLGKRLIDTYHTYKNSKDIRILKKTYWYEMHTAQDWLLPQHEEDIELVQWSQLDSTFFKQHKPIYPNIKELVQSLLE